MDYDIFLFCCSGYCSFGSECLIGLSFWFLIFFFMNLNFYLKIERYIVGEMDRKVGGKLVR